MCFCPLQEHPVILDRVISLNNMNEVGNKPPAKGEKYKCACFMKKNIQIFVPISALFLVDVCVFTFDFSKVHVTVCGFR